MANSTTAEAAAVAKAIADATRAFNTELWTLYGFGVSFTILRTYARVKTRGFSGLAADDFLIWAAVIFYTTQYTLAYFAVNVADGMANNSMTDAQREALDVTSVEYSHRYASFFLSSLFLFVFPLFFCFLLTRLASSAPRFRSLAGACTSS